MASGYVFTRENKGKEIAASTNSESEAIDLGIKFEKDSIVFYEGMRKIVPENEQNIIDELIDQEKSHLAKLVRLKEEL